MPNAWSKTPLDARFHRKVRYSRECWEWTGTRGHFGHGVFLTASKPKRTIAAHRWAYEHFIGPIPDGMCVLHRCDNPPCVKPAHLFLGTRADNVRDMDGKSRRGKRDQRGMKNPSARLSDEDVARIRELAASGVRRATIAEQFGIHPEYVTQLKSGRKRTLLAEIKGE